MARATNKISSFPGSLDKSPSDHLYRSDPSDQIRELMDELQMTARDARQRQLMAEEERDSLQGELDDLQRQSGGTRDSEAKIERLERDCDRLAGQVESAERKINEALAQRDELLRKHNEERHMQEELQRARDEIAKEQESNLRQLAAARRSERDSKVRIEELQNHLAEAQKGLAEARKSASGSKQADSEIQRQFVMLRQARDTAAAQAHDHKQRVSDLEDALADLGYERDAAVKSAEKAARELKAVQQQLGALPALQSELEALRGGTAVAGVTLESEVKKAGQLTAEVAELRQSVERIAQERDLARLRAQERESELDQVRASLITARTDAAERAEFAKAFQEVSEMLTESQKQNEALMQECEAVHRQFSDTIPMMEARLKEQEVQTDGAALDRRDGAILATEHEQLLCKYEEQRIASIELAAQLASAQDEIKQISANLAEARLQPRSASRKRTPNATALALKACLAKQPQVSGGPVDEKTGKKVIAAMRKSLSDFNSSENHDPCHLDELHTQAHTFSERARGYGQVVIHRITAAFAAYIGGLCRTPRRVTAEVSTKIESAISFIAGLLSEHEIERAVHLSDARVYMVDDDPESSEIVSAALDCVGLKLQSSRYASAAIADLSEACYDLIVLDLDLPDLDGFELCSHIRKIPHHANTPIVFLTGYESEGNRDQSFLCGGNEFFGKPFSVQELGLNVLTHIIQAQLSAA